MRRCLLVLGMHRSGTSVLTRVLSLLGAALPKTTIQADENNKSGYWEPTSLNTLHNKMLAEAGSTWDDWRSFDPAVLPKGRLRHYKAEIGRLISDEFTDTPLFVLKDPRVCRFVPLYEEILGEVGIAPLFVHTLRNPLAVIASLGERDNMTEGFASLLWLRHVLDSEAATRSKLRAFVSYEDFMVDWRVAAHNMAGALGLEWPRAIEDAAPEIEAHLTPELQHHNASSAELDRHPEITGWVKGAYAGLTTLVEDAANSAALAGLHRVKEEFDAASPIFGRAFFPELAARQKLQQSEIEELIVKAREVDVTKASLSAEQARRASAEVERDTLRLQHEAMSAHLAEAARQKVENAVSLATAAAEKRLLEEQYAHMESERAQAQKEAFERAQNVAELAREKGALLRQLESRGEEINRLNLAIGEREDRISMLEEEKAAPGLLRSLVTALRLRLHRISVYGGLKVTMLPRHDLEGEAVGNQATKWTIIGDDPQFDLTWSPRFPLSPGHYRFRMDVLSGAVLMATGRLYVDSGSGYNEVEAISLRNHPDLRRGLTNFSLFNEAQRLRFDPSDSPGQVVIGKVRLRRLTRLEYYGGLVTRRVRSYRMNGGSILGLSRRAFAILRESGLRGLAARLRGVETPVPLVPRTPNSALANYSGQLSMFEVYARQVFKLARPTSGIDTEYVPKLSEAINLDGAPLQIVAFYLPQFHPIPENNEWWGRGFTEWTNVSKAVPQYIGHYQPHLPGELGFYDLRLVDVMRQQVELARQYGIGGFCFHHYWFGGKRLLERPVDQFLAAKDIAFPFCLCWANENWTRRWDGQENEILLAQQHSPEDDIAFIEDIIPALRDERYIRFNNRPILIVYRAALLPDAAATAARWRERCKQAGIEDLFLIAARSFNITDPRPYGFDAAIEFPPHQIPASRINDQVMIINPDYRGNIYNYEELASGFARQQVSGYPLIKTVMPSWDNEPRKPGAGHTFHGATPAAYARWLRSAYSATVEKVAADENHPPFLFINAWNEWAEGAHLEPDRKYGYAYLHATTNVAREFVPLHPEVEEIVRASQEKFTKRSDFAVILHLHYDDLFGEVQPYVETAEGADLFLSLRADISPDKCREISSSFPNARLAIYPNRGRDIQPFLHTLRLLREKGYDFACKIHSKKSPQRRDGDRLRTEALSELLGSKAKVNAILKKFRGNRSLGLVAPEGSLLRLDDADRNLLNRPWLDRLFAKAGMKDLAGKYRCNFVAGSMFWFRVNALARIDELDLKTEQFEDELGQVDGTLAHAVERLFAAAAEKSGFKVE